MGQVYVGAGYPDECFVRSSRKIITPNRLFTYAFFRTFDGEMKASYDAGCNLMLDSGAFSVYTDEIRHSNGTAGKTRPAVTGALFGTVIRKEGVTTPTPLTISLEEYEAFIREHGHRFNVIVALDVINPSDAQIGAEGSYNNWLHMRDATGFDCIPVYHADDPIEYLDRYMRDGAEYIGIGGVAKTAKGKDRGSNLRVLHNIFDRITDASGAPLVKTHGFAMGTNDTCYKFPWTTVDSATATRAAELGKLLYFTGQRVEQLQIRQQDLLMNERRMVGPERQMVTDRLYENGYTWTDVQEFFPLRLAHNTMEMMRGQALIPDYYDRPLAVADVLDLID